ncbi:type II secretion system protein [Luteolibacter ambystomatis]|uniref:Type II secretion system protein n=1 Tax=Luteolibacter ambystomatis TaxID=2824561 RepID=A0A975G6L1_9BACT|nr:type II secretion system protein [Luteolibacter ambystomatis]QUE49908.1 type II secretion system protein [Luteolibacter ambystomatis]
MKTTALRRRAGMTLLELTVVILVLLSLIGILFIGARAWKKGSDRAGCILNVRNSQQAIRSYANMNTLNPGATIPGGKNREQVIAGSGLFMENFPTCPGGGSYGGQELTTIPNIGVVLMACNFGDSVNNHFPSNIENW